MKISKVIKVHPLVTANACTKCYLTPRLLRCFSRNQHGGPTDHHPSSCSTCKAINNRHGRQRILFSLNYVRWKHKQLISTSLHQHISYLLSPVPHEKKAFWLSVFDTKKIWRTFPDMEEQHTLTNINPILEGSFNFSCGCAFCFFFMTRTKLIDWP